jgi:hypothetical protein
MKGIVADLVVGAHGENGLAGRLKGRTMDFGGRGASAVASFTTPGCSASLTISEPGGRLPGVRGARSQRSLIQQQLKIAGAGGFVP